MNFDHSIKEWNGSMFVCTVDCSGSSQRLKLRSYCVALYLRKRPLAVAKKPGHLE